MEHYIKDNISDITYMSELILAIYLSNFIYVNGKD
jgi:hypothetical protein